MSLVNDALQRAKQHTAQPAPVSNLQLLPLEPIPRPEPLIRRFPIVITILVLVAIALVFTGWFQHGQHKEIRAKSVTAVTRIPEKKPAVALAINKPAPVKISELPAIVAQKIEAAKPITASPAPPTPVPTRQALPPKLQAIFFNQTRPSAMINGKTLYVGNRVGDYRIAAITANSATLVSATSTNILSFAE